jgi:hypothetical protein
MGEVVEFIFAVKLAVFDAPAWKLSHGSRDFIFGQFLHHALP